MIEVSIFVAYCVICNISFSLSAVFIMTVTYLVLFVTKEVFRLYKNDLQTSDFKPVMNIFMSCSLRNENPSVIFLSGHCEDFT